jgi:superfamily I DNA/RNA helicase
MSVQLIEGGAGTGKTTTVIERLTQLLMSSPLGEHQRVLALTKMHGSRRRVRERLRTVAGLNGRFESVTIDSFAWRLITRWRSLARLFVAGELPTDFDARCDLAGRLLEETCVQKWVAASFPIVIVDELQDSKGGQLRVLQGLATRCECIVAGDPFQDLEGEETCASVEWARKHGQPTVLTTTHRTNNAGLLAAATSLRNGQAVLVAGGFGLKGVAAWALGAYELAAKITRWSSLGSVAVITPVGSRSSPFVRQVVERVNREPPLGKKWKVGPFKLRWEVVQDEQVIETCRELGLPDDDDASVRCDLLELTGKGRVERVRAWLSRQRRLFGRTEFTSAELRAVVKEVVQHGRLYSNREEPRLVALSIHQAKNREFDRVIVLWPYQVTGTDERKRRLAYNAITRARHEAFIIVESEARASQQPFALPNGAPASGGAVGMKKRTRRKKEP